MFGKSIVAISVLMFGLTGTALAQTPSQISQYNAWGAYSYQQGNGKVCYVLSVPIDKQPAKIDHGDNFFMVSQKPGQNVSFEPQFKAGYDLQANSKVVVKIDERYFLHVYQWQSWLDGKRCRRTATRRRIACRTSDVNQRCFEARYEDELCVFAEGCFGCSEGHCDLQITIRRDIVIKGPSTVSALLHVEVTRGLERGMSPASD